MATKKAAPAKAEVKAAPAKKPAAAAAKPAKAPAKPAAKTAAKSAIKKGTKYSCSVCGMVVAVDTACGCASAHPVVCCNKPMKVKK